MNPDPTQPAQEQGKRNPFLTPAMERVLRILVNDPHEYLIGDRGEWWVGDHRTNQQTLHRLLHICVLSGPDSTGGCEIYTTNSESSAVLNDPKYVPLIVRHQRGQLSKSHE
jgi:hypothetical protein